MSRDRRRRRRPTEEDRTAGDADAAAEKGEAGAEPDADQSAEGSAQIYENEMERAWAEAPPSMQGIDRELMRARRGQGAQVVPAEPAAALHPWLMVFGALMGGPVVAGVLALFSDGRAPKARDLVAILALSAAGWLGMQGLFAFGPERFGPRTVVLASQGLLLTLGVLLLLLYLGPMQGRRGSDTQTLRQSLVVVIGLTALYWLGRDAAWLEWLGR